jgi:hypothetical protein
MACKGKVFNIVAGRQNDDVFKAWPKNDLTMEDEFEDPTIYINASFESVDLKYKKNGMEMITFCVCQDPQELCSTKYI